MSRAPHRPAAAVGIPAAAHPVLAMQGRIGNQAAGRFVQAKLRVGPPGDVYEQEADRVADAVMHMPEGGSIRPVQRQPIHALQPKCAECEKEEQEGAALRRAPSTEARGPLNPHEEDDRDKGRSPSPLVQRYEAEGPEEEESGGSMAQRQETEKDEEGEAVQPSIHRKTARGVPAVAPRVEVSIAGARGGGHALPEASRSFFEPRFGADFSGVRVHSDSTAASTSRELGARAFTVGTDIFFGEGWYRPESALGGRLLAHELTHVIQQGGGTAAHPAWTPPAREEPVIRHEEVVEAPEADGGAVHRFARELTVPPARPDDPSGAGHG